MGWSEAHGGESPTFEQLQEILRESTGRHTRQLTTLVVALLYLLITVAATTDRQLLLPDSKVSLPVIGVDLPLFGFFIVAPFLVLVLHFNVLLNLLDHARKLRAWKAAATDEQLTLMPGFIMNYAYVFKGKTFNMRLVRFLRFGLVCLAPLAILLFIQIRFADYHDLWMTGYHFALIVLDVFILVAFWIRIAYPMLLDDRYDRLTSLLRVFRFDKQSRPIMLRYVPMFLVMVLLSASCLLIVFGITKDYFDEFHWYLPRIDVAGQTLIGKPPSDAIIQAYLTQGKTVSEARTDFIEGLDLKGRDLRYARFDGCKMQHCSLDSANLSRSSLRSADLERANLSYAALSSSSLRDVSLNSAILIHTNLQLSDLSYADLNGSSLLLANLNGCNLEETMLIGAYLYSVELSGAFAVAANLDGARIEHSTIDGTDLSRAQLNGATLGNTHMFAVDLSGASLCGADLTAAELLAVRMDVTKLRGAVVSSSTMTEALYSTSSVDVESVPDFSKLLKDSLLIRSHGSRREFVARITGADSLSKAGSAGQSLDVLRQDPRAFNAVQASAICRNTWLSQGVLMQNILRFWWDDSAFVAALQSCPDSLRTIRNRLPHTEHIAGDFTAVLLWRVHHECEYRQSRLCTMLDSLLDSH